MVAHSFFSFVPSVGSLSEHIVIGKAGASEGLSKVSNLIGCWIESKRICSFDFHIYTIRKRCVNVKRIKSAIPPTPKGIGFLASFL